MANKTTDRMLKIVASTYLDNVQINLQQSDKITAGFYSAVFSIPMDREFTFAQFNDGISELTENKFSIEAGSLYKVDSNVYRCILASTSESIPYTEGKPEEMGLHSVRANVFVDTDQDIVWRLEGEGENKRLVQDSKQDFGALLEAKRSRTPIVASDDVYVPYEEHDYACFFNHETLAMDFGYVVSREHNDYVFSRTTSKLVPLVAATQVTIADRPDAIKNPAAKKQKMVIAKNYSIESWIGYLREMYGADNPYYKAWEKAIKDQAVN